MERHTKMKRLSMVSVTAFAMAVLASSGCSKKESEEAPLPPPSPSMTITKTIPPPPLPSAAAKTAAVQAAVDSAAAAVTAAATDEESPAALAAKVIQLEGDYQRETDFQKKVVIIYDLSSTESSNTVDAVGRMFLNEKDQELKIELINSLMDIDGQNDKKLAILSSAIRADQPKEVRLEAIDGMGDVEDKRGIQVLQTFANDPDEDVRDAVKDTIDQLETAVAQPPAPGTPQPGMP
jgi:HEAT repeat protein